jgi:RNase P/RNase MRP subunit p29
MKNSFKILSLAVISTAVIACNNKGADDGDTDTTMMSESSEMTTTTAQVVPGSYKDLTTGKTVYIIADPQTGWAVDSISKVPVEFYIDNTSGDTLFQTGLVVNHAIMKADGKWTLDETKIKRDGNDIKIKYSDGSKVKIDGEDVKIKTDAGKIKLDDDTVKVKPNN